jgi:hypothetical protein
MYTLGLKTSDFSPEFKQFKHILPPAFTGFENREPLVGRVRNLPMVEVLNLRAKIPPFAPITIMRTGERTDRTWQTRNNFRDFKQM